ncbi:hypothetical protein BT93_L3881 [Corymbia citriodora subsp. variegata]|uniref:Saposin B-type domain-containing protein n=1 Tax=Corymbia citriodora subsp. variegata TaxID=360336 RepID=A0A8T0CUZ6_CORYI|nr:hypothetical protein BT93_L3881 [Corymbia citriodora subsp. variegata]
MAKINAASILVLCLIHVLTLPTTSKGYTTSKHIVNMCQTCEIVVSWLYHQVQEKEAHISPRKITKDEIVQYSKNICNSAEKADQISNIDIVKQWDKCELVYQASEGKCNSEGKNIEGACRKVMSFFSKDVDRHKLKSKLQYDSQVQLLCRNFSMACGWKLPPEDLPREPSVNTYPMDTHYPLKQDEDLMRKRVKGGIRQKLKEQVGGLKRQAGKVIDRIVSCFGRGRRAASEEL